MWMLHPWRHGFHTLSSPGEVPVTLSTEVKSGKLVKWEEGRGLVMRGVQKNDTT